MRSKQASKDRLLKVIDWLRSSDGKRLVNSVNISLVNKVHRDLLIRWLLDSDVGYDKVRITHLLSGEARVLAAACDALGFEWEAND